MHGTQQKKKKKKWHSAGDPVWFEPRNSVCVFYK